MKIKNTFAKVTCLSLAFPLFFTAVPKAVGANAGVAPHSHDDIEFTAITSMPGSAGNYYLEDDITLSEPWEVPAGKTSLCLNGHVVNGTPSDSDVDIELIRVKEGATLNIYDCDSSTNNHFFTNEFVDKFNNVAVAMDFDNSRQETADYVIQGGCFNGRANIAFLISKGGTVNMYGGSICFCDRSNDSYSAVSIEGGEFNLYGGSINNNYGYMGGGVYVDCDLDLNKGVFNMYGGSINDNDVLIEPEFPELSALEFGGGVCVAGGFFNLYDGLITNNNTDGSGGGVAVHSNGTFIMYDGEISNNVASYGGGVSLGMSQVYEIGGPGEFIMKGGEISNNKAIEQDYTIYIDKYGGAGGAVFVLDESRFKAEGGTITNNHADNVGGGVYLSGPFDLEEAIVDPYYCVAGGTEVTLGDGTKDIVDNLTTGYYGSTVQTFNHETGELTSQELLYLEKNENVTKDVMKLNFSNSVSVTIIGGHSFFNQEDNKYVTITPSNVESFINKHFYNVEVDGNWVTLDSYEEVTEPVSSYSVVSKYDINFMANGMLSCGDELYEKLVNIFDYGDDLKYDAEKKTADIDKYGIFEFEDAQFATKQTYDELNLKYLKVAIGKGVITPEYIKGAAEYQGANGSGLVRRLCVYFGGDIKILDNTSGEDDIADDVFLWSNKNCQTMLIGTGESGNGVKAPDKMQIGVTLFGFDPDELIEGENYSYHIPNYTDCGAFTYNGSEDDVKYFVSNDPLKCVVFKDGHLELEYIPIEIPEIEVDTFEFDGEEKTFDIPESDLYTIEGETKATAIGEYKVKLVLNNKEQMTWDNGSSDDVELTFTITKKAIEAPKVEVNTFTYDGTDKSFGIPTNSAYTITGDTHATAAGEYKVTLALADKTNSVWKDGSSDDIEYTFTINKKTVEAPQITVDTFTFDGTDKSFDIPTNSDYTITGDTHATAAGEYKVTLALADKTNTTWNGGSTEDIEYTFNIVYGEIEAPKIDVNKFVYDGTDKSFNVPTNEAYTIEGETHAKDPGTYTIKLVLKDKETSSWKDGSTDDIELKFTINQKAENVEVVFDGENPEAKSPVTLVDGVNGVQPEAVLVVKVVKVEDTNEIQNSVNALENGNYIKNNETIFGCYDAKLLINNVEVQPEGDIKIQMEIPSSLLNKDFKLYHIHAGSEVIEVNFTLSEDGKYLVFNTDKLSQFVFVSTVETGCIVHWFMLALLVVGIIGFVVLELLLDSKLISSIEAGAALLISIILAIIGKCNICLVLKIICLIVFTLLLVYALLVKRNDNYQDNEDEPIEPEEAVSENDSGLSLKESFANLAGIGGTKKFSKKFIVEYLEKHYKDSIELNSRENSTKPARGQKVGLPLADTHYVLGEKGKKCFVYVYEKDEGMLVLANMSEKQAKELKKEHELVSRSAFPKSPDSWYSIVLDDSWDESNLSKLLDQLYKDAKERVS